MFFSKINSIIHQEGYLVIKLQFECIRIVVDATTTTITTILRRKSLVSTDTVSNNFARQS